MPWVPEAVDQWNPDLMNSVRRRMEENAVFNQSELDEKFILASALRILVRRGVTELPKGGNAEANETRSRFMKQVRDEIIHSLGDSVPAMMLVKD